MNQYDTPLASFDLRNVTARTSKTYEPVPAGNYLATIINAEIRTSKNGTDYLFVRFALAAPEYVDRSLVSFFFLWNEKNLSALGNYKALREACGLNPDFGGETTELIDKQVVLYVDIKNNRQTGDPENVINFYSRPQAAAPAQPVQPVSAHPVQAQAQAAPMPKFVQPSQPVQPQPVQHQAPYMQAAAGMPSEQRMANIEEVPF